MKIETKFNLGDELWTIEDRKALRFVVNEIAPYIGKDGARVYYYDEKQKMYREEHCYPSREALITSL